MNTCNVAYIEKLRLTNGYATKKSFAEVLDIHPKYYSQIINGDAPVSLSFIFKLAAATGEESYIIFKNLIN